MTTQLEDDSQMPFGMHKGKPMSEVPARYLHWFWTEGDADKDHPVMDYIRRNLSALKKEYEDGIWS